MRRNHDFVYRVVLQLPMLPLRTCLPRLKRKMGQLRPPRHLHLRHQRMELRWSIKRSRYRPT